MYDSDLDVVGEDEMVLGAATPQLVRRGALGLRGGGSPRITVPRPAWMPASVSPQGVAVPKEEMDILPFNLLLLPGSATAPVQSGFFEAFPQRPFRGERVIASATLYTSGTPTDASDFVFINPAIFVGAVQVGASQGLVPLSVFKGNAFGVRLSMPTAGQGTRVYIPVTTSFPTPAGDVISCTLTIVGKAVR